jgi:hypothetical protein
MRQPRAIRRAKQRPEILPESWHQSSFRNVWDAGNREYSFPGDRAVNDEISKKLQEQASEIIRLENKVWKLTSRVESVESSRSLITRALAMPEGVIASLKRRVEALESAAKPEPHICHANRVMDGTCLICGKVLDEPKPKRGGIVSDETREIIERFFGQQGREHDAAWQVAISQADHDALAYAKRDDEPDLSPTVRMNDFLERFAKSDYGSVAAFIKGFYSEGVKLIP